MSDTIKLGILNDNDFLPTICPKKSSPKNA